MLLIKFKVFLNLKYLYLTDLNHVLVKITRKFIKKKKKKKNVTYQYVHVKQKKCCDCCICKVY